METEKAGTKWRIASSGPFFLIFSVVQLWGFEVVKKMVKKSLWSGELIIIAAVAATHSSSIGSASAGEEKQELLGSVISRSV